MSQTNDQSKTALSRCHKSIDHRNTTADDLISLIEESNIKPLAMQTISPFKTLNLIQCKNLAGGIRDCIIKRLDTRRRIPVFTPLLTIFERNDWDKGYHIHTLIPWLPLDIWAHKKPVKHDIKVALDAVSKLTDISWEGDGIITKKYQIEFYKYCIKNPLKTNNWNSNFEHGLTVHYPNGRGGVEYTLRSPEEGCGRHKDWKGIVEYMCKNLYAQGDIQSELCESTYLKLRRYNVKKNINNDVSSTLEEFFV